MKQIRRYPAFIEANRLVWHEQELSAIAPDMIRLEAVVTGISAGTEGMWFEGSAAALRSGRKSYPYTPGYEFVGRVSDIGSNIIKNPQDFPRFSKLRVGDRIFAFKPHGSFADMNEGELWVLLPDHVSNENALAHALCCTCLHAIHRASPSFGDASAVFGLGTLGFIMIQLLSSMQSKSIVAITTSDDKKNLAKDFGASTALSLKEVKNQSVIFGMQLADCIFECSGSSEVLQNTTLVAANQATIVAAGFYNDPVILDGEHLFSKELNVKGVRAAGAPNPKNEYIRWPRTENLKMAAQLIEKGAISIEPLITHKIAPENMQNSYEMIRDRSEAYLQIIVEW